jgi:predicted permease
VSAGLLVQTLTNALHGDLGFGTRDAVVANVEIPTTAMTPETAATYFEQAVERVRALPGVEAVSLARSLPLGGRSRRGFSIEGYQPRAGEDTELNFNIVDNDYFETMRVGVVEGRTFDRRDAAGSAGVAIVNDTLAQRYLGGHAVGKRLRDSRGIVMEIVGVVRTGKHRSVQEPPLPIVYYPFAQSFSPSMTLIARTTGDAAAHADTIRRTVRETHANLAVFRVMTLSDHLAEALGGERLTAALVSAAGAMALVLAIVGVYGVIAYGVVRRRKEIGVRVALGAAPFDVVRLVVAEGLNVTLIGIALGTIAALGATQLLASMLYGVDARDVTTFATAAVLLTIVALLAAWMPARRAVRLDPVAALRQE